MLLVLLLVLVLLLPLLLVFVFVFVFRPAPDSRAAESAGRRAEGAASVAGGTMGMAGAGAGFGTVTGPGAGMGVRGVEEEGSVGDKDSCLMVRLAEGRRGVSEEVLLGEEEEEASFTCAVPDAGEARVGGGLLGAGVPCAEVGLEPRRRGSPVWGGAAGEDLVGGLLGAGVTCAEVGLEIRRFVVPVVWGGGAGEVLVGGLLGASVPCAEVGLEPRRPVWGTGRPLKGFSPGAPGAGSGNGNGLGNRRSGFTKNGGIGPAEGSISMVGDSLSSLLRPPPLVGSPVVGQRYPRLACQVKVLTNCLDCRLSRRNSES